LGDLAGYIIEESRVPSESLESSTDMQTLVKAWQLNYNAKLTTGLVMALQSALQSRLFEMLFIGPCCDIGLGKIKVDITSTDCPLTVDDALPSSSIKLHLLGTVGTVKVASGYPLINLLGIQFYVNGNLHDSLESDCSIPALLIPTSSGATPAAFEVAHW
jgi:hypothetical protein